MLFLQPIELQQSSLVQYNGFGFQMTSHHKVPENPPYSRKQYHSNT